MRICYRPTTGAGCRMHIVGDKVFCPTCGMALHGVMEALDPDARVGAYSVIGIVGYGTAGVVYVAEPVGGGAQVALKETVDSSSISRWQAEFAALRYVQHPNLPAYGGVFEHGGKGYLVMEYVPGQSLDELLASSQAIPPAQALDYAIQLCDALIYLHAQQPPIIHRDIKPANVRLMPGGRVKLVDFGILKVGTARTQTVNRRLTPAYAPLEQWNDSTDERSDIYSLGATLYHLLTGLEPPSALDRASQSPDPLIPPAVFGAPVVVAMALQRDARFQTAEDMAAALIAARDGRTLATPTISQQAHTAGAQPSLAPAGPTTGRTVVLSTARRGGAAHAVGLPISAPPVVAARRLPWLISAAALFVLAAIYTAPRVMGTETLSRAAPATVQPSVATWMPVLEVDPARGTSGTSVRARGTGWPGSTHVMLQLWHDETGVVQEFDNAITYADGTLETTLHLRSGLVPGSYGINAYTADVDGDNAAGQVPVARANARLMLGVAESAPAVASQPSATPLPQPTPGPSATSMPTVAATVVPEPTALPTATTYTPPPTVAPTEPGVPQGSVASTGNVRQIPRVAASKVLGTAEAGQKVELQQRLPDASWYLVVTAQGVIGWMSATLLSVDEATRARVPVDTTNWAVVAPMPTATPVPSTPQPVPGRGSSDLSAPVPGSGPLVVTKVTAIEGSSVVYIVGIAENTTNQPIGAIQMTGSLLMPDGSIAGQANTNISGFEVAPPHGQFPFVLLVDVPADGWTRADVQISGSPVTLGGGMSRYLDLTGEVTDITSSYGWYEVSGTIRNVGSRPAQYMQVVVIAYDDVGKLIALERGYVPAKVLPAGGAAAFDAQMLYLKQRPARLVVLAQAVDGTTIP